jgi:predicted ferric reductase
MHGDWTKALHDKVKVPTTRPVFIAGPFASPYATANKYDNLILVASGIGITPALSIIAAHKEAKRVNLIW